MAAAAPATSPEEGRGQQSQGKGQSDSQTDRGDIVVNRDKGG